MQVFVDLARLLFLRGSQVLPGLHPAQHALLLLRWEAGEMLQPLPQYLLLLGREATERRIAL